MGSMPASPPLRLPLALGLVLALAVPVRASERLLEVRDGFVNPTHVVAGQGGLLYVADTEGQAIRMIDGSGHLATLCQGPYSYKGGDLDDGEFHPGPIAIDAHGDLVGLDHTHTVFKVELHGTQHTPRVIADMWRMSGPQALQDPPLETHLRGLAPEPAGTLLATWGSDLIRIEPEQGFKVLVPGLVASTGNSKIPIARDKDGTVYLGLQEESKVLAVTPEGHVSTLAGHPSPLDDGSNVGLADGPGASAGFFFPNDLVLAPDHSLLLTEPGGGRLRRIDLNDPRHTVTTLMGQREFLELENQPGVDHPAGLTVDPTGRIFITDEVNRRVKEVGHLPVSR
ncbi:MAG: Serine/threonine-protein kinase PknD [Cyanobacteria bacterium RYN_339]|nr:Serine/threonine-protein kinase PknD [Cyanobacteria bacterium RYN_339]